jgi:hypothetical protein
LEPGVYSALQRWADAEMRSMNAQIEFLLRSALQRVGRLPQPQPEREDPEREDDDDASKETSPE